MSKLSIVRYRPALMVLPWLIVEAACATGADAPRTPGYRQGVARFDCAPWDGAAFHVTLSDPVLADGLGRPAVILSVWSDVEGAVGSTIRIDRVTSTGTIAYCPTLEDCALADVGEVRITSFARDTLRGRFGATWPDGRRMDTDFVAVWETRQILCGD